MSEGANRVKGDIANLDAHVEANEAEEIIALDILHYFPSAVAVEVLRGWVSKLAHGGTLTLSFVDCKEAARGLLNEDLTIEEFSGLIYGKQQKPWEFRKCGFSVVHVASVFEADPGFRVMQKRMSNYVASITIKRL